MPWAIRHVAFYFNASGLTEESADRLLETATWQTEGSQPHPAEQMWSGVKQALPSAAGFYLSWAP